MDELNGEIVCAVEKWCKLIAGLSSGQRAALAETPLRSSCGLFVIEVMEHWDGDRWTTDFTQVIYPLFSYTCTIVV